MVSDSARKKAIRERMDATAENYTTASRAIEAATGLAGTIRPPGGGHRGVARLHDGVQGAALVGGVTLHRLHQVGDEVIAALELHIDLRPGGVDLVALADQPVVGAQRPRDEQHEDETDQAAKAERDVVHSRKCLPGAGPNDRGPMVAAGRARFSKLSAIRRAKIANPDNPCRVSRVPSTAR
jgi:hypothetical protein